MRTFILFTICTAGFLFTSCENKERLEEIKATLKNERPARNSYKEPVSISTPELNLPKEEVEDFSFISEGINDYSESEYDDSYEDSDYDSDYDYDSEYND